MKRILALLVSISLVALTLGAPLPRLARPACAAAAGGCSGAHHHSDSSSLPSCPLCATCLLGGCTMVIPAGVTVSAPVVSPFSWNTVDAVALSRSDPPPLPPPRTG